MINFRWISFITSKPMTPTICTQVQEKVEWLKALGLPAIPVAPAQDPHEYPLKNGKGEIVYEADGKTPKPKFNGKNPSFLGTNGKPYPVAFKKYQKSPPTVDDYQKWFANPANGIGTIPGKDNLFFIDLDAKTFKSQADCDNALSQILEHTPKTYYERTRSGGYHIALKVESGQDFTNFKLGDVAHAGEVKGNIDPNKAEFVVLAPTTGYESLNGDEIAQVKSLSDLGIHPTKGLSIEESVARIMAKQPKVKQPKVNDEFTGQHIDLARVISRRQSSALTSTPSGDRSKALTAFTREVYGWATFLDNRGVSHDSADSLISLFVGNHGIEDKADRILEKLDPLACVPSLERKKGIEACEDLLRRRLEGNEANGDTFSDDINLDDQDTPGLVVWRELYEGKPFIAIGDDVYEFVGTHYEKVNPGKRRNVVANLLKRCTKTEISEFGVKVTRPFATNRHTSDALNYSMALMRSVPLDEVGKGGLNCLNGVLKLTWVDGKLETELAHHSPTMVFLAPPKVTYDPDADRKHLDRLLETIEPEFRGIMLGTLAASLDLDYVRSKQHRAVRILALLGGGSNGKDSWKDCMSTILSNQGVTSVPLVAFQQYDQGRQFGLVPLAGARINWPSENSFSASLDRIESLKNLVTGEALTCEEKNKQGEEFNPRCVPIFNGNAETLKLVAGNEAIASRYAIIPFKKTFKRNPDPNDPNELLADPNFRNVNWLAENVCSALLNALINELQDVADVGIDYDPVHDVIHEHTKASNHLAEFIEDFGLIESKGNRIAINEIWESLRSWYKSEGLLKIDDNGREIWGADDRVGDKLIRSPRQLSQAIVKFLGSATNKGSGSKSGSTRYIVNVAWMPKGKPQEQTQEVIQTVESTEVPKDEPKEKPQPMSQDEDEQWIKAVENIQTADQWNEIANKISKADRDRLWGSVLPSHQQRIIAIVEAPQEEI